LEGIPDKERGESKHENIDEDFGLLELATNAGRDGEKEWEYCIFFTLMDSGIRLMARMTSHVDDSMICFNVVLNVS
jgi:hypothetical protein